MPVSRRFLFLFLFLSLLFLMASCGSDIDSSSVRNDTNPVPSDVRPESVSGRFGGVLRYPLPGEPETFNPLAARESRSRLISHLTNATLLEFDPVTQTIQAGVVKSYNWLDQDQTLHIALREGVKFSDGVDLTTEDVLFTFEQIFNPASNNVLKDTLQIDGSRIEVTPLGPLEAEIRFPKAYSPGLYLLTTVPLLPRHCFEPLDGPIEEYWTLDTPADRFAGLGPFQLASHEPGRRTTLRFNPHYWRTDSEGSRLPYLDEIVFEYIEDRNTQILRLESGDLDLIEQVIRPEDLRLLEASPTIDTVDAGPSANLIFFWFNQNPVDSADSGSTAHQREWFSNLKFRRAISCLISRETIIRNIFLGLASEASGIIPASNLNWFTRELETFRYDPERGRALLREAGFTWEEGGQNRVLLDGIGRPVEFELLTRADEVLGNIAAVIQQDLAEVGIRVSIRQEELRAAIGRIMGTRDYDSALMNLEFPTEPADMRSVLMSSGSMHIWNPSQERPASQWEGRVDDLMRRQVEVSDHKERFELFREVQSILADQVPFTPLVNRNVLVAKRKQIAGLEVALVFPYSLSRAWQIYHADDQ
ncbi:MAG: ABC transporter substrate-binding protein [Acidobacteriota bacterium]|nr:MAG: ABC transporter substrate-binding protein [Acidobacteriota bacterium]